PAVLVLLGHGDDEAQVALDELLQRILVAGADLSSELDLLRPLEQRVGADLVEVLVEDIALRLVGRDPGGGRATAAALDFGHVTRASWRKACCDRYLVLGAGDE